MERKRKAFSALELIAALVIISCVIAAFAPIMTKRGGKQEVLGSTPSKKHEILITPEDAGKDEYYYSCDSELTQDSNGKRHLNCTLKNLPEMVSAILVGAGGAGGSALDGGEKSYTKEILSATSTSEKTMKLTPYMKNIKITLLGAGGGGGGAPIFIVI